MWQTVWDFMRPYVQQALTALAVALVAVFRAWLQKHVALSETTRVELEAQARVSNGLSVWQGYEKKAIAMEGVIAALPLGVRPITRARLGRLVEAAVPKARKIASNPPPGV